MFYAKRVVQTSKSHDKKIPDLRLLWYDLWLLWYDFLYLGHRFDMFSCNIFFPCCLELPSPLSLQVSSETSCNPETTATWKLVYHWGIKRSAKVVKGLVHWKIECRTLRYCPEKKKFDPMGAMCTLRQWPPMVKYVLYTHNFLLSSCPTDISPGTNSSDWQRIPTV